MERVIYIGKTVNEPVGSFLIDIPAVHLRNHLYDSLNDYAETSSDPFIYELIWLISKKSLIAIKL